MSEKHIYGYQQVDSTVQVERQKTQNSQHNIEGEQGALRDAVNPTKGKARCGWWPRLFCIWCASSSSLGVWYEETVIKFDLWIIG